MSVIQITVGFTPIEMFADENIQITRTQRNLRDLNKLFADFSQSFTIPASDWNNNIFSHWYDLAIANSINAAKAIFGTWLSPNDENDQLCIIELLGCKIENGVPVQYEIVIYGVERRISDQFGERLLNTLNLSQYNHYLDYTTLRDSWQLNLFGGDILYPIFDYERGYIYEPSGNYAPPQNIATATGGVRLLDLRPAISLRSLFSACFAELGINLTGSFFTDPRLDNSYLLPMEKAGNYKDEFTSAIFSVENSQPMYSGDIQNVKQKVRPFDIEYDPSNSVDLVAQTYTVPFNGTYTFSFDGVAQLVYGNGGSMQVILDVNGNDTAIEVVNVQEDQPIHALFIIPNLQAGDVVWLYFRGSPQLRYLTIEPYSLFQCSNAPQSGNAIPVNMSDVMPNIKITDFLRSYIDAFNLVFTPVSPILLSVDFLETWYQQGQLLDITPYANTMDYKFAKGEIPTTLLFKHDQKDDIGNTVYNDSTGQQYGSSEYVSNADFTTGELNIETVFSVPVPDAVEEYNVGGLPVGATNLELVKAYDTDLKPVQIPLLLFFYAGEQASRSYYIQNDIVGNTFVQLSTWPYCRTYSERPAQTQSNSLAFGIEPVLGGNEDAPVNTLVSNFWGNYLRNTFDQQNRTLVIEANLEQLPFTNVPLNTIILYNNQSYLIQELTYSTSPLVYTFTLERYLLNSTSFTPAVLNTTGNTLFIDGLQTNDSAQLLAFNSYRSTFNRILKPLGNTAIQNVQRLFYRYIFEAFKLTASTLFNIGATPVKVNNWNTVSIAQNGIAALTTGDLTVTLSGMYVVQVEFQVNIQKTTDAVFELRKNSTVIGLPQYTIDKGIKRFTMLHSGTFTGGDVLTVWARKTGGGPNLEVIVLNQQINILPV